MAPFSPFSILFVEILLSIPCRYGRELLEEWGFRLVTLFCHLCCRPSSVFPLFPHLGTLYWPSGSFGMPGSNFGDIQLELEVPSPSYRTLLCCSLKAFSKWSSSDIVVTFFQWHAAIRVFKDAFPMSFQSGRPWSHGTWPAYTRLAPKWNLDEIVWWCEPKLFQPFIRLISRFLDHLLVSCAEHSYPIYRRESCSFLPTSLCSNRLVS